MFEGKTILLGVSGGIAVYKAVDLASRLKKQGAKVDVILTSNATEFVTPLTFRTITGRQVYTDMFEEPKQWDVRHIALAEAADMVIIAPATANIIGKLANGIADDMLSTTVMATKAPVFVCPAMNTNMYENPAVQENISVLKQRGMNIIEPAEGRLACGTSGKGRLPEPEDILRELEGYYADEQRLAGKKVVITAGPTREPLDPVRFITNHSSGKMGFAIAKVARQMGAEVVLVTGPVNLATPNGVKRVDVTTGREMLEAVQQNYDGADMVFFMAAVADYRAEEIQENKIKKQGDIMKLELVKNCDIAFEMSKVKKALHIGACAETEAVEENAIEKLEKKAFDVIMANDVTQEGAGFNVDTNIVTLYNTKGERLKLEKMLKEDVARKLIDFTIDWKG